MELSLIVKALSEAPVCRGALDRTIAGISCDSRKVRRDFIFVAVHGVKEDGSRFIREAVEKGASAVVVKSPGHQVTRSPDKVAWIEVRDERKALAELACAFYRDPSREVKVCGVTGTNGKTTITYLIEHIVHAAGSSCGVVGTINYRFKDRLEAAANTTPGPVELQSLLARMRDAGVKYCAMEVSSHALDQRRTEGICFDTGVFTNLTQDHLDYHKDIESYFLAKARLFAGLAPDARALINIDDPFGLRLAKLTRAQVVSYGIDALCEVRAGGIRMDMAHTGFELELHGKKIPVSLRLIGRHNVYNALAAFAWGVRQGMEPAQVASALGSFTAVPGRLERLDSPRGFFVFVDYAHTEDALKNVLVSLRQLCTRRIIVVFGCGGDRDKTKRPKMGRVVSNLADFCVITSDNPRSEDPQAIIRDITGGISKDNFCVVPDRLEAIRESLARARTGDIVLVAGKGHEDHQVMRDSTIHFDDREAVRECLRSRN